MILNAENMEAAFGQALSYEDYLATGTEEQQRRWQDVYESVKLSNEQETLLGGFVREMKLLMVSGIWCGDCVLQGPIAARIAEASAKIELRIIDRDVVAELRDSVMICGGTRVPVMVFMAEDFAPCCVYGDRTLSRYRALARERLGQACSTGLFLPDVEEVTGVVQNWIDETERVQLMLRLSTRLREKHND